MITFNFAEATNIIKLTKPFREAEERKKIDTEKRNAWFKEMRIEREKMEKTRLAEATKIYKAKLLTDAKEFDELWRRTKRILIRV